MKKNGFTLTELLAVIVILAILAGIAIPLFIRNSSTVKENEYQAKKEYLASKAIEYASDNRIENAITTTVSTLIRSGYVTADKYVKENSEEIPYIVNPVDEEDNLACHIINITLEDYDYKAEVLDEANCELTTQEIVDSKMGIKVYEYENNKIGTQINAVGNKYNWTNKDVIVVVNPTYTNVDEIRITHNGNTNTVEEAKMLKNEYSGLTINSTYSNIEIISAKVILKDSLTVAVQSDGTIKQTTIEIQIDKEVPKINTQNFSGWTSSNKPTLVYLSDGNGSGPDGVYLTTSNNRNLISNDKYFKANSEGTSSITEKLNNGVYYLFAKDKAGNISNSPVEFKVENIDDVSPVCVITGENTTWTNKPITITWGCTDSESGCDENNKGGKTVFQPTTTKTAVVNEYKIKDNVGNETTCSSGGTTVNVYYDNTPPTCVITGENTNWTTSPVTIKWGCADNDSGCDPNYSGGSTTYTASAKTATIREYTIKDKAGNVTKCSVGGTKVNVYHDVTAPRCQITGQNTKWTNHPVTVKWGCVDSESGCDPNYSGGSTTFNSSTTRTSVVGQYTIKDKVGNTTICSTGGTTINTYFDNTPPTITAVKNPLPLDGSDFNFLTNIRYSDSDSGINTVSCNPASSRKTGIYSVTCTAKDNAGNSSSVTFQVKHQYPATFQECHTHDRVSDWCSFSTSEDTDGIAGNERGCCVSCQKTKTVDCSYYYCPQGGTAKGETCFY